MALLDGVLAASIGGEMAVVVSCLLDEFDGLEGLIVKFESAGHGSLIESWIGTGCNQSIAPNQVYGAVGDSLMRELAAKAGVSTYDLASKLSAILPTAIDTLTPLGKVSGGPIC